MEKLNEFYYPRIFKIVLILIMIWNTGFFTVISNSISKWPERDMRSRDEIYNLKIKTREYIENKIEEAKQREVHGNYYSPDDYFRDLVETEDFFKKIDFRSHSNTGGLQAILIKNMEQGIYSWQDLEKAREKYKNGLVDKLAKRDESKEELKSINWINVLSWFVTVYFFNLIPVAFIFLIWMLEAQEYEKKKFRFPNPAYFIWTVLAHPFYITRIFIQWANKSSREWLVEAEYRRTKSELFVYITEGEERRIKDFAENGLPIQIWRQMLRLKGLRPVHSLATILCVMVIIAILPRLSEAKSKSTGNDDLKNVSWQKSVQHLPRINIDKEKSQNFSGNLFLDNIFLKLDFNFQIFLEVKWFCFVEKLFSPQETFQKIAHIPLQAV